MNDVNHSLAIIPAVSGSRPLINLVRRMARVTAAVLALGAVTSTVNAQIILAQTDLGTNPAPGTNVAPFTTDYHPLFLGPNPGEYQIGTNGINHGPGDWGGVDHTTGTGCFMLCDGSDNSAQAVISCTFHAVAGFPYTLSGWAMNLVASGANPAVLSFRVNGSELGTFTLIGAQTWHQFTFTYTPVASGLTTFALHDDNTVLAANDFGLDDLALSVSAPVLSARVYTNGQFQFTLAGPVGTTCVIEASTNLVPGTWVRLFTNSAPFEFADTNASNYPQRFYRALSPP